MTPMIDVTFQLIIFFMLATEISKAQKEPVVLPTARVVDKEFQVGDDTVVVNISKGTGGAKVVIDGKPYDRDMLGTLFDAISKSRGDYLINIRVDRDVDWGEVQRVLGIAQKKGNAKRVIISAEVK